MLPEKIDRMIDKMVQFIFTKDLSGSTKFQNAKKNNIFYTH